MGLAGTNLMLYCKPLMGSRGHPLGRAELGSVPLRTRSILLPHKAETIGLVVPDPCHTIRIVLVARGHHFPIGLTGHGLAGAPASVLPLKGTSEALMELGKGF